MSHIKRWAFVPLAVLLCAIAGNAWAGSERPGGTLLGWVLAAALAVPLIYVWDRRRRREVLRHAVRRRGGLL